MDQRFIHDTPIDYRIVKRKIVESGIYNLGKASIRELVKLVSEIEEETGQRFIRMEMGVPGLPPNETGTKAEIDALQHGVAATYPILEGLPELKEETSRFAKLFLNIDVPAENCIPSTGSMQGSLMAFMVSCRRDEIKDTTLFLDPGFPLQKQQHQMLGLKYETFDVYDFRGEKLKAKIESYLKKGNISTIIYSNPNNPSWICLTEKELSIIGKLAKKYDIIVVEDLAYFAMDFRKDYSVPGKPPYQPTVANYTDNYIILFSSSKIFSYAGQRLGMMIVSPTLYNKRYPTLNRYFSSDKLGHCIVYGTHYAISAGVTHSVQYAVAAILKAANEGEFNITEDVKIYGEKAHIMKQILLNNGFKLVYDQDEGKPIADGFYFTFSYPGFTGNQLLEELLYYGISAISLETTGSMRLEGLRACVSMVGLDQMDDLDFRASEFHEHQR